MIDVWQAKESKLIFGDGQSHVDPVAGLALFGPFKSDFPRTITIAIIGSRESLFQTRLFLESLNGEIVSKDSDPILFPRFPGFQRAFKARIEIHDSLLRQIPSDEIRQIVSLPNPSERVIQASEAYLDYIEALRVTEPQPDIVICSIPKGVEENCWSSKDASKTKDQKSAERKRTKLSKEGQLFLDKFDEELAPVVEPSITTDLHSRIKAGSMVKGVKTQIILETSISDERTTEPRSMVAWNLSLALFYKSNGFPWRLAETSVNDCFVGISFYKERSKEGTVMGTSIAQIFDNSGNGMILKGGKVELTREDSGSPHMSFQDSKILTQNILEIYKKMNSRLPERVVFHKTSKFWESEIDGLRDGLGPNIKADYLAVEQSDLRFVRAGEYPPLRGTCIRLGSSEYLVYTMGYIPYLGTYPGSHVPKPLHIMQHIGESTPQKICDEMMGLTKMNWNTAHFCSGVPITLNISRKVSSVLKEVPEGSLINPSYRFYM